MDIRDEIKELERRFAEAPDSRLFLPLADALFRAEEYVRARDLCEQGLDSYPDFVAARVLLGKCYLELGESEKARELARETIKLDSENEQLAEIVEQDGDDKPEERDSAEGAVDESGEQSGSSELADIFLTHTLADIYRIQGYKERALKIYRQLAKDNKADESLNKVISELEKDNDGQPVTEPAAEDMSLEDSVSKPVEAIDDEELNELVDEVVAENNDSESNSAGIDQVYSDDVLHDRVNNIFDVVMGGDGSEDKPVIEEKNNSESDKSPEISIESDREYIQMMERWIGELAG